MKKGRKVLSLFLGSALALSMASTGSVASAEKTGLTYIFSSEARGYAQGQIHLEAPSGEGDVYYLYWADNEKALEGYYEIAQLDASFGRADFSFPENVAIPPEATKLIAIKGKEEKEDKSVAKADMVLDLPEGKISQHTLKDRIYNFAAYADFQTDNNTVGSVYYKNAPQKIAAAYKSAKERGAQFISTIGDCVNNYDSMSYNEWQVYQQLLADSQYTGRVYEAIGNHEMKSDVVSGHEQFRTATGLNTDTEENSDTSYFEATAENGDHLIYMALEKSSSPNKSENFTTEQLDWLENTIEKYYGDGNNIFIFQHALFEGYGPGDNKSWHYYGGGLQEKYDTTKRLKSILESHKEVFFFTAHSHLAYKYGYNYDNEKGTSAQMFHVSSVTCPSYVENGSTVYNDWDWSSEGTFVDVYDDSVIVNCANLVDNRVYPQNVYLVEKASPLPTPQIKTQLSGDVNLDKKVNVLDATLLQKYLCGTKELDKYALDNSNVNNDNAVDIKDARVILGYINKEYINEKYNKTPLVSDDRHNDIIPTGSNSILDEVKDMLYEEYRYSSYNAYCDVKKEYYKVKDSENPDLTNLEIALGRYEELKKNNNIVSLYIQNNMGLGTENYSTFEKEDGTTLKVRNSLFKMIVEEGGLAQRYFGITINESKWKSVMFSNSTGKARTITIDIPKENNILMRGTEKLESGEWQLSREPFLYDRMNFNR